ncbi:tail assembly chaperone [Enterococcus sp. AZ126]|uniref:tail assembly chaperone n=1 Tax=Enterococcus sp. AZ126 TaxID=2774635 RepID=UPI003F28D36E
MELKINGHDTEIIFGLAFNREIDTIYKVEGQGLVFGAGLDTLLPQLYAESAVALSEVIYHGTAHIKKGRPSGHQVDIYIEEAENLDNLFEQVISALGEANVSKKKLAMWKKQLQIND